MDKIDHPLATWQAKIHMWMDGHDKVLGDLAGEVRKVEARVQQFEEAKPFSDPYDIWNDLLKYWRERV